MSNTTKEPDEHTLKLLADIMAEIQRGKAEAPRKAFGIEIPKDRANQFIRRYGRVTGKEEKPKVQQRYMVACHGYAPVEISLEHYNALIARHREGRAEQTQEGITTLHLPA